MAARSANSALPIPWAVSRKASVNRLSSSFRLAAVWSAIR